MDLLVLFVWKSSSVSNKCSAKKGRTENIIFGTNMAIGQATRWALPVAPHFRDQRLERHRRLKDFLCSTNGKVFWPFGTAISRRPKLVMWTYRLKLDLCEKLRICQMSRGREKIVDLGPNVRCKADSARSIPDQKGRCLLEARSRRLTDCNGGFGDFWRGLRLLAR